MSESLNTDEMMRCVQPNGSDKLTNHSWDELLKKKTHKTSCREREKKIRTGMIKLIHEKEKIMGPSI